MAHSDFVLPSPPSLELSDTSLGASNGATQGQPSQWHRFFSKSSNDLIARYSQTSTNFPENSWPDSLQIGISSRCTTIPEPATRSVPRLSRHGTLYHEPPLTSQRISTTPSSTSSQSISPSIPPLHPHMRSDGSVYSRPPSASLESSDSAWGRGLYSMGDLDSSGSPSRPSTSDPSVKMEPNDSDDGFINEFLESSPSTATYDRCQTPPTEVPLRATQASKEMRKMMGVFRLNPFTMHHDGGRGISSTAWNGEEVGPLEEEPKLYEYQLGCNEVIEVDIDSAAELRSFSPDFEIDNSINGDETGLPTSRNLRGYAGQAYSKSPPRQSSPRQSPLRSHYGRNIYPSPPPSHSSAYPSTPTDDQPGPMNFSYGYSLDGYIQNHRPQSSGPTPLSSYPSSNSPAETPRMQSRGSSSWSGAQNTRMCGTSSMHSDLYTNIPSNIPVESPTPSSSTPQYMQAGGTPSTSASRRWSLPANPHVQTPFIL